MTLLDTLKQDLELAEKATPGPWACTTIGVVHLESKKPAVSCITETVLRNNGFPNGVFMAASRTRWPATTRALIKTLDFLDSLQLNGLFAYQLKELKAEIEKELG